MTANNLSVKTRNLFRSCFALNPMFLYPETGFLLRYQQLSLSPKKETRFLRLEKRWFSAGMLCPYRQIYYYDYPGGRSIPVYRLLVKSGDFLRECFAPTWQKSDRIYPETGFLLGYQQLSLSPKKETRFLRVGRKAIAPTGRWEFSDRI